MAKRIVIALGGNALGNTPYEQLKLVEETAKSIVDVMPGNAGVFAQTLFGILIGTKLLRTSVTTGFIIPIRPMA